nr:hypothetical protein [Candidatus Sigynarchaeota archaeon]
MAKFHRGSIRGSVILAPVIVLAGVLVSFLIFQWTPLVLIAGASVMAVSVAGTAYVNKVKVARSRQQIAGTMALVHKSKLRAFLKNHKDVTDQGTREMLFDLAFDSPEKVDEYFAFQEAVQAIYLIDDATGEVLVALYPNYSGLERDEYSLVELITCFIEQAGETAAEPASENLQARSHHFADIGKEFFLFNVNTGTTLAFVTDQHVTMPAIVPPRVIAILEHVDAMGAIWDENRVSILTAMLDEHLPWSGVTSIYSPSSIIDQMEARQRDSGESDRDVSDEIMDDLAQLRQAFQEKI